MDESEHTSKDPAEEVVTDESNKPADQPEAVDQEARQEYEADTNSGEDAADDFVEYVQDSPRDKALAYAVVLVQAGLLVALFLLPRRNDWHVPLWAQLVCLAVEFLGAVLLLGAVLRLGSSLTPLPLPYARSQLKTTGAYRICRHPIYTGLILIVIPNAYSLSNWLRGVFAATLLVLFVAKSRWEERLLLAVHPEYADYAKRVGRFMPVIGRWREVPQTSPSTQVQ